MNKKINTIIESINGASNVVLMTHENTDFDALGAIVGIYYIVKSFNKNPYIVLNNKDNNVGVSKAYEEIVKAEDIIFTTTEEVKNHINDKTLLIILDCNTLKIVSGYSIIENFKNIIVIDHHIIREDHIKNTIISYVDVNKSSTCEIILDIIGNLGINITPIAATIILSGIKVDTNNFTNNTRAETYDAAAKLIKYGADQRKISLFFKEDILNYIKRYFLIGNTYILNEFAISLGNDDNIYSKVELAKITEQTLLFEGIKASFTIAYIEEDSIEICARSIETFDVEGIMRKFNGGGHKNKAVAVIKNESIDEIHNKLINILENINKSS